MFATLIVNYYSARLIAALLAFSQLDQEADLVVVVNNSPFDTDIERLKRNHPQLVVLEAGRNLGFGGGCNLGLKYIYGQCPDSQVWLLNPDTLVAPGAVAHLKRCLKDYPEVAILGTRVHDGLGHVWFNRGCFNPWTGSLIHRVCLPQMESLPYVDRPILCPSRWVSGCSMVLNLPRFGTRPEFDPAYFLYYEDNDLCERYHQSGYPIAVTEDVLVTHMVSAIASNNLEFKWRNATYSKLYFLRKHGKGLALWLNVVYLSLRSLLNWLGGRRVIASGQWDGLRRFLSGSGVS
ncbi:MAG: glycosyltransferase family 2 protein [Leptolyngbyaceae cyanobacterium SM2_3_12]|nr:glycosyltransferase family 2 protein [Leptolyngbyaceae cyanobacterium SM2_3_12]